MTVAILSIGDELLRGEVVDTNAAHLGSRLTAEGLAVTEQLTVGDDEAAIAAALTTLATHHGAVIVTGGLGPTDDDVTARAAARATGRRLALNDEALVHLRRVAGLFGGESHPLNDKQALLPVKAALVPNPAGTACGFTLEHQGALLVFLPGVPVEMARMLTESVLPLLRERFPARRTLRTRVLTVFGLPEVAVGGLLRDLPLPAGLTLAYNVDYPAILVKLRGEGDDPHRLEAALELTVGQLRQRLGDVVVAEGEETMDTVVAGLFRASGATVALAESCSGGLVAKRLTDLAGSSAYFLLSAVTYANSAKERLLGVSPQLLASYGAVSREAAMAMARGARQLAGSDLGLAITGIAGPDGGSPAKPVGTVYLALAEGRGCQVKEYRFAGSRGQIRTITAYTALDWLRRRLVSWERD
ncbi:MAG TPA: CinA family nicotinamide mononucleotide deamidase-related protein [Geobacteraceae bacterium]